METISRRGFLSTSMFIFLTGVSGCMSDGNETGDTVTLEATDEPEWQEEGTGEYAADGDEIRLIVISPSDERSVFEAHRTTELSSKILRNLNSPST